MARGFPALGKLGGRMVPLLGWGLAAYDLWKIYENWQPARLRGIPNGWETYLDCGVRSGSGRTAITSVCGGAVGLYPAAAAAADAYTYHQSGGWYYRSEWQKTDVFQAGARIYRQANIYRTPIANGVPRTWPNAPTYQPVTPPAFMPGVSPALPPEFYPVGEGNSLSPRSHPAQKSPHSSQGQPKARDNPRTRPRPRRRERKRKEKEQKLKFSRGMRLVLKALNAATEARDVMKALFKALPPSVQRKYDPKDGRPVTDAQMAEALWKEWKQIEWDQAAWELVKNEIEDRVWAKLGIGTKELGRLQGSNMGVNRLLSEVYGDAWADRMDGAGDWATQRLNDTFGLSLRE